MGGSLAWTLRTKDGAEYRMNRWTNTLPTLLHAPSFLDGTAHGIEDALSSWLAMKADWDINQASGDFALAMTPAYAPYPFGLMPSEYGLVVTDFVTNTILSAQDYTSLGRLIAPRLRAGPTAQEAFPDRVDLLETLADAGRIASYEIACANATVAFLLEESGGVIETHPYKDDAFIAQMPGTMPLSDLIRLCDELRDLVPPHPHSKEIAQARRQIANAPEGDEEAAKAHQALTMFERSHKAVHNPILFATAILDLSPFTLETFEHSASGLAVLRQRVIDLGFSLSTEEELAWKEEITRLGADD